MALGSSARTRRSSTADRGVQDESCGRPREAVMLIRAAHGLRHVTPISRAGRQARACGPPRAPGHRRVQAVTGIRPLGEILSRRSRTARGRLVVVHDGIQLGPRRERRRGREHGLLLAVHETRQVRGEGLGRRRGRALGR
jgi:hypothetical protein